MERHVTFKSGEYYHLFNRGLNKSDIFFDDADFKYFQRLLHIRNAAEGHIRPARCKDKPLSEIEVTRPLVNIQAYSLLPDHFHLMVSEVEPGGITTYMRRLLTSYSMYINKKYKRSGPLMGRPFLAEQINGHDHLRQVISLIHLNPLNFVVPKWESKGVTDFEKASTCIREYSYSTFRDYFGAARDEGVIINKESLPIFISELEDTANMLAIHQNR